jgi:hypothetical protein
VEIEWVIPCADIQRQHEGLYTLIEIGSNGFMLQAGHLGVVKMAVMVCLVIEDDDEPGHIGDLWHEVIGPAGKPIAPAFTTEVHWQPGDSTQRIDPERYYVPLTIEFDVDRGGPYAIEIGTFTETKEISVWVEEIPSLED